MKYARMLGLLIVAAAALMAVAGSASATTVTSPTGTHYTGTIHAHSEGATKLDGTVTITCQKSTVHGHVTNPGATHEGGVTTTASGPITSLTFEECGNNTVTVSTPGSLEIHSAGGGNGTLTSTGAKVTVLTHNILGTIHCIYTTDKTHIGTLTGSHTTGGHATLHIGSAPIEQEPTDGFCGDDAEWTGSYTVTTPTNLYID